MLLILFAVAALIGWALHLMQEAANHREFSLMLAGVLVGTAAAALMSVYFLMGHWVHYLSQSQPTPCDTSPELSSWLLRADGTLNPEWWDEGWSE